MGEGSGTGLPQTQFQGCQGCCPASSTRSLPPSAGGHPIYALILPPSSSTPVPKGCRSGQNQGESTALQPAKSDCHQDSFWQQSPRATPCPPASQEAQGERSSAPHGPIPGSGPRQGKWCSLGGDRQPPSLGQLSDINPRHGQGSGSMILKGEDMVPGAGTKGLGIPCEIAKNPWHLLW